MPKPERMRKAKPKICNICFGEEIDDGKEYLKFTNPILAVCNCKGSSGLRHLECLRKWINQKRKVVKHGQFQETYQYAKSQCEVCSALYPDVVEHRGHSYDIFQYRVPRQSEYLVLE